MTLALIQCLGWFLQSSSWGRKFSQSWKNPHKPPSPAVKTQRDNSRAASSKGCGGQREVLHTTELFRLCADIQVSQGGPESCLEVTAAQRDSSAALQLGRHRLCEELQAGSVTSPVFYLQHNGTKVVTIRTFQEHPNQPWSHHYGFRVAWKLEMALMRSIW